ncbi:MAG: hypothetical protein EBX57_12595 [Betaproteobacteria bacterium]|nr:hypothetical protein [Betaproteobacteria bacterium]
MRTKPPKALWPQAGLSTVELALMLSLLLPLVMSTLQAAIWLQRHWQMEESAMAAARYVSLIEPSGG